MTAAPEDADADSAGDHHVLNDIKAGLDLHSTYRYISLSIYTKGSHYFINCNIDILDACKSSHYLCLNLSKEILYSICIRETLRGIRIY